MKTKWIFLLLSVGVAPALWARSRGNSQNLTLGLRYEW